MVKTFVELGRAYDPYWKGIPPHMLSSDVPVWTDFLNAYEDQFKHFYYDVALSVRQPPPQAITPSLVALWKKTWGKRIDVVGVKENEVWIIEVASNAFLRAIGQILTYYQLWIVKPPLPFPVKPFIVCRTIDEDVAYTAEQYGINWIVV